MVAVDPSGAACAARRRAVFHAMRLQTMRRSLAFPPVLTSDTRRAMEQDKPGTTIWPRMGAPWPLLCGQGSRWRGGKKVFTMQGSSWLTLLVNSKTPWMATLHPTVEGQRDRGCCVTPCSPMLLEIQRPRLNQQSHGFLYIFAESSRLYLRNCSSTSKYAGERQNTRCTRARRRVHIAGLLSSDTVG